MSTTLSRETLSLPLRGSVAAACAACADRLTAAVRLLPGVASAALDERAGRLSVEIDPAHVSPDAVGEQVKRIAGELADEWEHRIYRVGGMDCASCAASIETALNRLPGVSATVNFPAARLRVEHARGGSVSAEIEGRVRTLGFTVEPDARGGAAVRDLPTATAPAGETCCGGHDHEHGHEHAAPTAKPRVSPDVLRVTASGLLLAAGLVLEHGLGWERASAFVFAASMLAGGYRFALAGLRALRLRTVGTNLLMAVAAVGAGFIGQWAEAAAVVFLYALGETLEGAAMERTRRSLRTLIEAAPADATVVEDGGATRTVAAADLAPGDTILVRPGSRVAADGVIVSGASEVAEAAITGESLPRAKGTGDSVYAGSVNGAGALTVRVTATAEDSTLARILHLVEEAQGRKAPAQAFVERVGRVYTPAVIVAAVLLAVVGPLVAPGPNYVYRALTLLVVACPCALVIATPVAYVTAIARAARSGVLVKGGAVGAGRRPPGRLRQDGDADDGPPRGPRRGPRAGRVGRRPAARRRRGRAGVGAPHRRRCARRGGAARDR
jgi:Cd2+/Zn2+-exporting ATPase